jgi:hypothetical protein
LGELKCLPKAPEANSFKVKGSIQNLVAKGGKKAGTLHTPANITFVRSRMLYARATLNKLGDVRFGLRHIRKPVLNLYFLLLIIQMFSTDSHAALSLQIRRMWSEEFRLQTRTTFM